MVDSGVYQIENIINHNKYIGSAINIKKRWQTHINSLKSGTHHCVYLQRAFIKYGEESFIFSIIELCNKESLITKEQEYINTINPEYNTCKIAGSPLGVKHTDKTRKKVSDSLVGNKRAVGSKHTEEWKEENAKRMIGNTHSLGYKQSEETKLKKSMSCTGKHLGSKPWLGRSHSEETKNKMSLAQKGIPKTEEHKQKMRDARRRYFEKKREESARSL